MLACRKPFKGMQTGSRMCGSLDVSSTHLASLHLASIQSNWYPKKRARATAIGAIPIVQHAMTHTMPRALCSPIPPSATLLTGSGNGFCATSPSSTGKSQLFDPNRLVPELIWHFQWCTAECPEHCLAHCLWGLLAAPVLLVLPRSQRSDIRQCKGSDGPGCEFLDQGLVPDEHDSVDLDQWVCILFPCSTCFLSLFAVTNHGLDNSIHGENPGFPLIIVRTARFNPSPRRPSISFRVASTAQI